MPPLPGAPYTTWGQPRQIDAIERILAYVQAAAKGCEDIPNEWNTAFVVMRFAEDDNRAAFERGI